jgi:hypothetical protein
MLFVVDVSREVTAIHEANLLKIPVVAMVDTNCDPANVDYVIPSNDDAIRAIKLVVGKIADAALEGLGARKEEIVEEEVRTVARAGVEEAELSDEELLGESTLAKLVTHPKDLGEAEIEEIEEIEEEIAEEKGEEFELPEEEVSKLIGNEKVEETEADHAETEEPAAEDIETKELVSEERETKEPVPEGRKTKKTVSEDRKTKGTKSKGRETKEPVDEGKKTDELVTAEEKPKKKSRKQKE